MSSLEEGIIMTHLEVLKKRQAAGDEINWVTASFMIAFHIGAVAAVFFFTWKALAVAAVLWGGSTSLGIGVRYHRRLTHRGYNTPLLLESVLTGSATLAPGGGPPFLVGTHGI